MTQVKRSTWLQACTSILLASGATAASGQETQPPAQPVASLYDWVTAGQAHLEFRYRLEHVEQEPFADDAVASTLRTRLNFRTAPWHGVTAFVEVDNATVLGDETAYDSTTNGVSDRPTIADPEYTEMNQAWLQLERGPINGIIGRQRIALDDQRFIGNAGWRQNEQTYDAGTLRWQGSSGMQLQYSYIGHVNRVTGPDEGRQSANFRADAHVINARFPLGGLGELTAFDYLLDLQNAPALSSQSIGARWTGSGTPAKGMKLGWSASFVTQSDYGSNPNDYSADYYQADLAITVSDVTLKGGLEVLEGDASGPDSAFQTPLASLHAFQGWADKFLTTPPHGVRDAYVSAAARRGRFELQLAWHDFDAQTGSVDYGSEWDGSVAVRFGAQHRYELLLKAADYAADAFATDTTKLWLQVAATF